MLHGPSGGTQRLEPFLLLPEDVLFPHLLQACPFRLLPLLGRIGLLLRLLHDEPPFGSRLLFDGVLLPVLLSFLLEMSVLPVQPLLVPVPDLLVPLLLQLL